MVAVAIVWSWLLEPNFGLVNSILHKLGIQGPGWLTTPQWAMVSVILLSIWKNLGYNMVIFLAGLQDIPAEVYESAAIDGVTPWKNFWYITLPLLKAPLGFATIMSVIKSMQAFSQIYVMTGGARQLDPSSGVLPLPAGLRVLPYRLCFSRSLGSVCGYPGFHADPKPPVQAGRLEEAVQ